MKFKKMVGLCTGNHMHSCAIKGQMYSQVITQGKPSARCICMEVVAALLQDVILCKAFTISQGCTNLAVMVEE